MTQAIINLALPVIQQKVDEILQAYPVSPHQKAFASATLRDKLVAYVLRQMPTLYTTTDLRAACRLDQPSNCFSAEQQRHMESLIHQGIQHLLTQQQTWETAAHNSTRAGHPTPSSWFG